MKNDVKEINPETAAEMLKRNGNNRKLRLGHVKFLAREMSSGNWLFDGQPIRFTEGGVLLDGQHRLSAIIESNTTQKILVITGIDQKAFKVMDTGKNRGASDIFSIEGINNANECAAITRIIIQYKRGFLTSKLTAATKPSNTDLLDYYLKNKTIGEFAADARNLYFKFRKTLPTTQIGAYYYLMSKKHHEKAEEFWLGVCTGANLTEDSPVYLLRERLLEDAVSQKQYSITQKRILIFKSWNMFRKDETANRLKLAKSEKCPKLI